MTLGCQTRNFKQTETTLETYRQTRREGVLLDTILRLVDLEEMLKR